MKINFSKVPLLLTFPRVFFIFKLSIFDKRYNVAI